MKTPTKGSLTLRDEQRIVAYEARQIAHDRQVRLAEEVWQSITSARTDGSNTVLIGPTGVGKSNLERLLEVRAVAIVPPSNTRRPFVSTITPAPTSSHFKFTGLFEGISRACDNPFVGSPPPHHLRGPARHADVAQLRAVADLRSWQPVFCALDEAQHLTQRADDAELRQRFDVIKYLAQTSGIPLLLVGTHELLTSALLSGQLGRRTRAFQLLPYSTDDNDLATFLGAVDRLLLDLPLTHGLRTERDWDFIYERTLGSVGLAKLWFVRVLTRALLEGRSSANRDLFAQEAAEPGTLEQIFHEQIEAGKLWQQLVGSSGRLRTLVGLPAERGARTVASVQSAKKTKATSQALKPGRRLVSRDPVGRGTQAAALALSSK